MGNEYHFSQYVEIKIYQEITSIWRKGAISILYILFFSIKNNGNFMPLEIESNLFQIRKCSYSNCSYFVQKFYFKIGFLINKLHYFSCVNLFFSKLIDLLKILLG